MPPQREVKPTPQAQTLLLKQLAAMRASRIRDLMRDNEIKGLSNNKSVLMEKVRKALTDGDLAWATLINHLDRHEPYGKQRVRMLKAPLGHAAAFSATTLHQDLAKAGHGTLWDAAVPVAAPERLTLSAVQQTGPVVTVFAIGRRTYRERVRELEGKVELPRDGLEVQLYQRVDVRAWARADLDTATGALLVRASALPQTSAQNELFADFLELIGAWFPLGLFEPQSLGKAIQALHDDERGGTPCEARVQAVGFDDASGRKTTLRSAGANQSVNGAAPGLQKGIDAIRASGRGADGNFFFLPTSQGGPVGVPIGATPVRVIIRASEGQVDFPRPVEPGELEHVLHRIRVLAT